MSVELAKGVTLETPGQDENFLKDEGILFASLDKVVNWARRSSIWPMSFGLACCAIEMMSMAASRYDISRFGAEVFRGSPRQSDLMIIAGRVSQKWRRLSSSCTPRCRNQMGHFHGCVCTSGGVFNNYAIVQGVNQVIPIDVYVPGCRRAPKRSSTRFPAAEEDRRRPRQLPPLDEFHQELAFIELLRWSASRARQSKSVFRPVKYLGRQTNMPKYGGKEIATAFRTVRKNTIQVAEDIPEGKYEFKATPDTRSIAQTLVHIAYGLNSHFPFTAIKLPTWRK